MRKILILLTFAFLLPLAACSDDGPDETPTEPGPETTSAPTETEEERDDIDLGALMLETPLEAMQLNQVGYRPSDEKVAVFAGIGGAFHVVCERRQAIVHTGETTAEPVFDEGSNQDVFHAGFSDFDESGTFFLVAADAGRSPSFTIEAGAYQAVKNAVLKMLYHQRCGMPLDEQHAGDFAHAGCHENDAYLHEDTDVHVDTTGGWHDAGDYGKYTVPTAKTIADLLLAYEHFPDAFEDPLNIPESGSGVSDIVSEVRHGIDWMLKMQDPESGGVHHKVSTNSFPSTIPPDVDQARRYVTAISPTATANFAATMAMSARTFATQDPEHAQEAEKAARHAWDWLEANPDAPQYTNPPGMTTGEYGDSSHLDEWIWAAAELYRLTQEDEFHEFLQKHAEAGIDWNGFGWQNMGGYATVAYSFSDESIQDESLQRLMQERFLGEANRIHAQSQSQGYRHSLAPDEFYWGSNMLALNRGMHLILAHLLSGDEAFVQSAQDHLHYLLGRNPLGKSFVSGFGSNPLRQPHHRPTWSLPHLDPFPGLVAGGPNHELQDPTAESMLPSDVPPAKAYVDHPGSYSTNEVTIYWNSPAVFVSGFFDR